MGRDGEGVPWGESGDVCYSFPLWMLCVVVLCLVGSPPGKKNTKEEDSENEGDGLCPGI